MSMYVASLQGKLDEYLALTAFGLNALQLDVKDEHGIVAFSTPSIPAAREIGATRSNYQPYAVAAAARERNVYLIGRIVVFYDRALALARPETRLRTVDGESWNTSAGVGWTNPYDEDVWSYNLDIARAAALSGFDEIMFDYVRFPVNDPRDTLFAGELDEPRAAVVTRFVRRAVEELRPYRVRVSAAVFGYSATENLSIGQRPRRLARYLDSISPMVYPSLFYPGSYKVDDPDAVPGRIVEISLGDFRKVLDSRSARLVPWLQDFSVTRQFGVADVQAQVAAARKRRVDGFLLWNPHGVYTRAALAPSNCLREPEATR